MRTIDADALKRNWTGIDTPVGYRKVVDLEVIDNAPTVDTTCPNCDSGYAQGYSDGYLKGKEERPQGEWIPVSEKLPKIDAENGWKASDVVLVCLADEKIHMGFYCEDDKWRFCESGEVKELFWKEVIAWMPLPEPYKEAENE